MKRKNTTAGYSGIIARIGTSGKSEQEVCDMGFSQDVTVSVLNIT